MCSGSLYQSTEQVCTRRTQVRPVFYLCTLSSLCKRVSYTVVFISYDGARISHASFIELLGNQRVSTTEEFNFSITVSLCITVYSSDAVKARDTENNLSRQKTEHTITAPFPMTCASRSTVHFLLPHGRMGPRIGHLLYSSEAKYSFMLGSSSNLFMYSVIPGYRSKASGLNSRCQSNPSYSMKST